MGNNTSKQMDTEAQRDQLNEAARQPITVDHSQKAKIDELVDGGSNNAQTDDNFNKCWSINMNGSASKERKKRPNPFARISKPESSKVGPNPQRQATNPKDTKKEEPNTISQADYHLLMEKVSFLSESLKEVTLRLSVVESQNRELIRRDSGNSESRSVLGLTQERLIPPLEPKSSGNPEDLIVRMREQLRKRRPNMEPVASLEETRSLFKKMRQVQINDQNEMPLNTEISFN